MKPIIVIPTYNEIKNIEKLIHKVLGLAIPGLELIIVDDHSPDGTAEVVERLAASEPIHLIARPGKYGIGSAYLTGIAAALALGADTIFEMDADFSHDPDDIPRLLAGIEHADLVIGSRKIPMGAIIGWGWTRKTMSAGAMWLARLLLGLQTHDVTSGFRCFRRCVLESIDLSTIRSNGYAFQEELLYRTEQAGWRILEIPVTFVDRQAGQSKLSKKDIAEFFVTMATLAWRRRRRHSTKGA